MRLELAGWDLLWAEEFKKHEDTGLIPGRVFTRNRHVYAVYTEAGEVPAEVAGAFFNRANASELPAVGDWVVMKPASDENSPAIIESLLPRRTKFSRKTAGSALQEQIIAANIDLLFVVVGLDQDYNLRRLERYLVAASESGVSLVIVLNKTDVCSDADLESRMAEVKAITPNTPVLALTALSSDAIATLLPYLPPGKTAVLVGSSGAGKSTIVNQLLGMAKQDTQTTRLADGRGRHTTTQRELFILPGGGLILDNPGIRELQLWPEDVVVADAFTDIGEIAQRCAFRDCRHQGDKGCAIEKALGAGELDQDRWQSYLKLNKEVSHIALQFDSNARREQKQKMKKIFKDQKRNYKESDKF